ncbi:hypothetical protein HS088_TW19G00856 [Tripterygium wilfordii]|uniref:F-box associated beta-propeller type 1 domain-containing protein n=1 Tax=Tripterygium wilfordii TaxID=458696 RepID=A0A7J7CAY0_TRIWF|nr:hypothetical protein HS088_TW19G00856 [Tripterygium wilfordii]
MAMITSIFSSIPQHIVEDIMESLPVKAIVRFKSLSKHYFSYFTSSSFIFTHYLFSSLNPSLIIPLHCNPWLVNFNISNIKDKKKTTNLVIESPFPTSHQTRVVSCSFGLVCVSLTKFHTNVVVWNPATGQFRTLPESSIDIVEFLETRMIIKICLGFGFDRAFEDFKVVRIVYHLIETDSIDLNVQVEVFRRSTGTWRSIDLDSDGVTIGFDMEETKIRDRFPATVVNGVIYWNAIDNNPDWYEHFIVAFDISDETFRKIPLPQACENVSYWCILQWENSIATFVPQIEDQETVFDVWLMRNGSSSSDDDDDDGEGWIKVMSIGGFPDLTFPIMASNGYNHHIIVMKTKKKDKSSDLIMYDFKTKQSKNLRIEEAHNVYMAHQYVESLVSVYGEEGNEAHV